MGFSLKTEVLIPNKQVRYYSYDVTMQSVLQALEEKMSLSKILIKTLAKCPLDHYVLEFPPVSGQTLHGIPFSFVVTKEARLDRKQSLDAFQEHYQRGKVVVNFKNLSGESTLVVPLPGSKSGGQEFSSIGPYSRTVPMKHQQKFWKRVARCILKEMKHDFYRAYWLSTSGLGVPWLHARIDKTPKYYVYGPFKTAKPTVTKDEG